MPNNFLITQGAGTTIATEQGAGTEHYQKIKLIDPTLGSTNGIGNVTNPLRCDPTGTTIQPIKLVDSVGINVATIDASGDLQVDVMNPVQVAASNLAISITGTTGISVTAVLPAITANFHYISLIEIVKYFTVANAASATPLVISSTNLPGGLSFTFGQPLGAIGATDRVLYSPNSPIKSSVANTATTIVCPATTGIIWRLNILYFAAP